MLVLPLPFGAKMRFALLKLNPSSVEEKLLNLLRQTICVILFSIVIAQTSFEVYGRLSPVDSDLVLSILSHRKTKESMFVIMVVLGDTKIRR
jgi:hypothetical protein